MLIEESTNVIKEAYSDSTDPFALLDYVMDKLFKIQSKFNRIGEVQFLEQVAEVSMELKAAAEKGYMTGIPTGSAALDRHTGGYQKGDLIIGGARPSMGKTTFTIDKALKQAKAGIKVGYISLEVTAKALIKKMYSNDLGIDGKVINRGGLTYPEWQRFDATTAKLMGLPIYIYDTGESSIQAICSWMRKMNQKHGVEMFYMDYIQLASAVNKKKGEDANRDVSEISKSLKRIAMSLDVPVFALSQLSREVEKRANKYPVLSDLRDSGSLEQDADMVILFFRPEYYKIPTFDDGSPTKGVMIADIAKFRNGEVSPLFQKFDGALSRIDDVNHFEETPF
jgi:replicative DNA helicase